MTRSLNPHVIVLLAVGLNLGILDFKPAALVVTAVALVAHVASTYEASS